MSLKLILGFLSIVLIIFLFPTGCDSLKSIGGGTTSDSSNIAIIEKMTAVLGLGVYLKPINAKSDTNYVVDLLEKGKFRESRNIKWTVPQINVKETQAVFFSETKEEENAYGPASWKDSNWWRSIFSIKIHEPSPTTVIEKSVVNLIYPNGGEIWHIGDKVNIKWTTNNANTLPKLDIFLSHNGGKYMDTTILSKVVNNGSCQWTATGETSTNCRIAIGLTNEYSSTVYLSTSKADFTISAPNK
jgi:hypothetical protein